MAGPNPYKLHSFGELRAVFGQLWVRYDACWRFRRLRVTLALRDRDRRYQRFRCSRCGGPGRVALERLDAEPEMQDYLEDKETL